jgi:hypothetical protein
LRWSQSIKPIPLAIQTRRNLVKTLPGTERNAPAFGRKNRKCQPERSVYGTNDSKPACGVFSKGPSASHLIEFVAPKPGINEYEDN